MPDFERHPRDGEEWFLRGRLRLSYLSGRVRPLEILIARSQPLEESKRRSILLAVVDGHRYEIRVYRTRLFAGPKPLDQLRVSDQAVGAGLEVTPIDGACKSSGQAAIFQEAPGEWIDPSAYLHSPTIASSAKELFLESIGRYCRRIHDAGFFQPEFSLSTIRTRVLPRRTEFRLHDLEEARIRETDDDDRLSMLGSAWQKLPLPPEQFGRLLQAYGRDGENVREIFDRLSKKHGGKSSKPGRFSCGPYEVLFVPGETNPKELEALYQGGLKGPEIRIVRSPDALTLWKRALKERQPKEPSPVACFVQSSKSLGFVVYRDRC